MKPTSISHGILSPQFVNGGSYQEKLVPSSCNPGAIEDAAGDQRIWKNLGLPSSCHTNRIHQQIRAKWRELSQRFIVNLLVQKEYGSHSLPLEQAKQSIPQAQ